MVNHVHFTAVKLSAWVGLLVTAASLSVPGDYLQVMAHAGEKTLQPGEWLKNNVCLAALEELYVELHDQAVAVELFSASDNARLPSVLRISFQKLLPNQE